MAYFTLRMRETAIFVLPVKKSDVIIVFSDPDFSYGKGILVIWPQVRAKLHIFSLHMRKTVKFLLSIKNLTTYCVRRPRFPIRCRNFGDLVINCIFFIAHARNAYISTSGQKSDVTIVFPDPDLL